MGWWGGYGGWAPYVPVAQKIANAKKAAEKLRKKGVAVQPVELSGRKIATSFWGKGWCDHMESFHDYENRLPRGRSYVRNGSVVHLEVAKGEIKALVAGSETYTVDIKVELLSPKRWKWIKQQCAGQIASLLDLLKGKLSDGVMRVVTDKDNGLFPGPREFTMKCSCPDIAGMCKHIAAVFYGVGARLDAKPELLFLLRGVDHAELAVDGGVEAVLAKGDADAVQIAGADLSEMFGIELLDQADAFEASTKTTKTAKATAKPPKKTAAPRKGASAKTAAKTPAKRTKPSGATAVTQETKKGAKAATRAKPRAVTTRQKAEAATEAKASTRKARVPAARKPRQSVKTDSKKQDGAARLEKVLKMVKEYTAGKKGVGRPKRSK